MAHFAKLGIDNVVTAVLAVDTIDCMTRGGIEREDLGVDHLVKYHGHENWKKCSYNTFQGVHKGGGTPLRANYPSVGWYYNSEHDIFHPPKPYNSWTTLNTTTGMWEPPITKPDLTDSEIAAGKFYDWNETAYQSDNTVGWELKSFE